jgi:hypothetical protein
MRDYRDFFRPWGAPLSYIVNNKDNNDKDKNTNEDDPQDMTNGGEFVVVDYDARLVQFHARHRPHQLLSRVSSLLQQ